MDDGVFQLAPKQNATALQQKNLIANLQALSLFGIDDVYACHHSLAERGILPTGLAVDDIQALSADEVRILIDRFDQVITL